MTAPAKSPRWVPLFDALTVALLSMAVLPSPALADPMRPLPGSAAAASAPASSNPPTATPATARVEPALGRLAAIRQDSAGRRQALVGERWVAVGDRLDQARVLAIGNNAVELATGRTRSTLHLLPPLVASPAAPNDSTNLADARRAPPVTARPAGDPTP